MKTAKAYALSDYIDQGMYFYTELYVGFSDGKRLEEDVKEYWNKEVCEELYNDFLLELRDNMLQYDNTELIHSYLLACLGEFCFWTRFKSISTVQIIQLDYETEYLIELKDTLSSTVQKIQGLLDVDNSGCSFEMWRFYKEYVGLKEEDDISNESYRPLYDERYNFNELKATCDDLTTSSERINLLNDRLIDLKQWELQYDVVLKDCGGFKFSPDFYPNFSQLCVMELTRQEKMLEFESKMSIQVISTPIQTAFPTLASKYVWKAKDTDLLELSCSLCLEDAIGRLDGGKMTRKELIGVFEDLFGIQIKDAEGKLNKATNRNDKTPFLDRLRTAFHTYSRDKDEKIRVRA